MKNLLVCLLIVFIFSCVKKGSDIDPDKQDTVLDEYRDWYVLKSPVDRIILGVWGNYDETIVISTGTQLFRTTDKGKRWDLVHESTISLFGIVQYQDTLFVMNGLATQSKQNDSQQILITADHYSVNDGKSWQRYKGTNPVLYSIPEYESTDKFFVNPIPSIGGDRYEINKVSSNGPGVMPGIVTTPGVITSTGRRIDLPQLHQIQSLFLDDQQRLYIVGSDATCSLQRTSMFCNSSQGRGIVYISKKKLP